MQSKIASIPLYWTPARLLNQPNDVPEPNNPHKKQCMVAVNGHCERFVGAIFAIHALSLPPAAR